MTFALITATRFQFSYDTNEQVPLNTLNKDLKRTIHPTKLNTNEHNIHSIINDEQQIQINLKQQQQQQQQYKTSNTMKLMQIIQIFMTVKNGTFLFIAWYEFNRKKSREFHLYSFCQIGGWVVVLVLYLHFFFGIYKILVDHQHFSVI